MAKLTASERTMVERIDLALRLNRDNVRSLARRVGSDYDRVRRVLHGERRPLPGELDRLARAAGLPGETGARP